MKRFLILFGEYRTSSDELALPGTPFNVLYLYIGFFFQLFKFSILLLDLRESALRSGTGKVAQKGTPQKLRFFFREFPSLRENTVFIMIRAQNKLI